MWHERFPPESSPPHSPAGSVPWRLVIDFSDARSETIDRLRRHPQGPPTEDVRSLLFKWARDASIQSSGCGCRTSDGGLFAIPLLQSSLALPGAPASVRLDLGRSYLVLDQPDEALPHLQSSAGLDTDGSVHYQLAQALQRLGMREQAREALAQYQALDARQRQQTEASASLDITPPE